MSRQTIVWVLMGVLLLIAAGVTGALAWWRYLPHATLVPPGSENVVLIRTTATEKVIGTAVIEAVRRHQNYIVQPDGSKSDPTYRASSQSSRRGEGVSVGEGVTFETSTSSIQFRDAANCLIRIDTTRTTNEPTLISITCEPAGDPSSLTAEILHGLRERGVHID